MNAASPPAVTLHDLTVSCRGHPAVHHLSGTIHDVEGRIERDPAERVAFASLLAPFIESPFMRRPPQSPTQPSRYRVLPV